jgi:hypothetical protein
MKRILYANGSVLTGNDIATSVVRYAAALARAKSADTVQIPTIRDDRQTTVEMLIGPSSQLMIEDAGEGPLDVASAYLEEINSRRDRMEHPAPIGHRETPESSTYYDEF